MGLMSHDTILELADLSAVPVTTIADEHTTFGALAGGKVALVVNVASRCGLSPQYEQLEALHRTYRERGFTVIGFPSNQFLQELGSEEKIATYCSTTWGVTFPMSERVKVNGSAAHPLYKQLTKVPGKNGKAGRITWNFEKFVIGPHGQVRRFSPKTRPDDPEVLAAIEEWLPAATS